VILSKRSTRLEVMKLLWQDTWGLIVSSVSVVCGLRHVVSCCVVLLTVSASCGLSRAFCIQDSRWRTDGALACSYVSEI
jgi:hypothetical protein